jgi:hypothetical protein
MKKSSSDFEISCPWIDRLAAGLQFIEHHLVFLSTPEADAICLDIPFSKARRVSFDSPTRIEKRGRLRRLVFP